MFYDILDQKRRDILPYLENLKDTFYLAGGTALALQIGHRDSVDFDFFSKDAIDTVELFEKLRIIFQNHKLTKIQEEADTLTVLIDNKIKISFFTYKYKLCKELIDEEYIKVASIQDIACMKFSAITGRATNKDYIDLYFILQKLSLSDLLELAKNKYPELDQNILLKSLIYFEDIVDEPIIFKHNKNVVFEDVKKSLQKYVKELGTQKNS